MVLVIDAAGCSGSRGQQLLGASLQYDLVWLLSRAGRAMSCVVAEAMSKLSLDVRGATVLKTISTASAPTQVAISQIADIDKSTLVTVLDDLERKQFVRRLADPDDRRARIVELTDEGRRVLAWCESAMGDIQKSLLEQLDPADSEALLRSLPQLIGALDRAARGEEI